MSERISVPGPAGALEVVVEEPRLATPAFGTPGAGAAGLAGAACYAVICHPHPLYGGTMDNKVVTTLARALREVGMHSLRFNFRGVGASDGAFDEGNGETADADAVAVYGAARWPGRRLVLAGFSFGGYVALRLALTRVPARLITIAPAIQRFEAAVAGVPDCPWLVVQGDADDVVDPQAVISWARSLAPPPRLAVLQGVGHFFHGHLHELRDAVIESIRSG